MAELNFTSKLTWSGGRLSRGLVEAGGEVFGFSVPASMGGLGAGTNPEELLLSAVGSCYTATLAATLEAAQLPAASMEVRVDGRVSDYPGRGARVATITVSPTFVGVEPGRSAGYESAAAKARERCFVGRHLDAQVDYRVGAVTFAEEQAVPPDVLDVRALPPARRHQLIFATLADLPAGTGITLVNDHDPKPLHHQLDATEPGRFSWEYLERGPGAWRVRIGRVAGIEAA
jgi:peroxiredoxin-like protein